MNLGREDLTLIKVMNRDEIMIEMAILVKKEKILESTHKNKLIGLKKLLYLSKKTFTKYLLTLI